MTLTACDPTNQASGPGAVRFVDGEPSFIVCEAGVYDQIFVTARADGRSTEIWRAMGGFTITEAQQINRDEMRQISADFDEKETPAMHSGDSVSIALAAPEGGDSTGVVFLVTQDALEGRWVDASGAPTEPSCH